MRNTSFMKFELLLIRSPPKQTNKNTTTYHFDKATAFDTSPCLSSIIWWIYLCFFVYFIHTMTLSFFPNAKRLIKLNDRSEICLQIVHVCSIDLTVHWFQYLFRRLKSFFLDNNVPFCFRASIFISMDAFIAVCATSKSTVCTNNWKSTIQIWHCHRFHRKNFCR